MTEPEIENDDTDQITDGTPDPASVDVDNTPDDDPGTADQDGAESAIRKARREAAGLRKRLRDTETERDQLSDQLDTHRQDVINDIATQAGLDPALLTDRREYELATFITNDGRVDREKVSQACADAAQRFNITRKGRPPAPNPQQGRGGGTQRQPADEFISAFRPKPL